MKKNEADRLRDIADILYDHGYDIYMDSTNDEALWFRWAAEEIRKVLFNSGYPSFNNTSTTTKHMFSEEEDEDECKI